MVNFLVVIYSIIHKRERDTDREKDRENAIQRENEREI
jgi:hypothetical protein